MSDSVDTREQGQRRIDFFVSGLATGPEVGSHRRLTSASRITVGHKGPDVLYTLSWVLSAA